MKALEAVLQARALLADVTPLRRDCGKACGAACCAPDADGQGGMLLFSGEEALYDPLPAGYALQLDDTVLKGMRLLTCNGRCDRSMRPLACRMFPLIPVLQKIDGRERLRVMIDPRAFAVCPLSESGLRGLDQQFSHAVLESARVLCLCEEHKAYFRALAAYFARLRAWGRE